MLINNQSRQQQHKQYNEIITHVSDKKHTLVNELFIG